MVTCRPLSPGAKAALAAGSIFASMLVSRSCLGESLQLGAWRWLFRLQLALFVNSLMLIGSLYIWRRTVSDLGPPPVAAFACLRLWQVAVLAFLGLAHSSSFTSLFLVAEEPHLFSLAAYSCLGAYIILLFLLGTLGGVEQACRLLAPRCGGLGRPRRPALRPALAVAVTAALSVAGLLNAARPPAVRTVPVPVHQLPASLHNLKVVLLSDIHLGPTVGRTKMETFVSMANALAPDVTVIVGDLSDAEASALRSAIAPLGRLRSRLGTYFVTGNHDYYTSDVANWFALLESLRVRPLHNENVKLAAAGAPSAGPDWLCLAGVDDIEADLLRYSGHGMDLARALEGCGPDRATVLLAHQPLAAKRALQARPDIDLVLCGHTHAGQFFPLNVAAYLLNPFFAGLYRVAPTTFVYVSAGTAYYGIPMRLGSRAEITELLLQRAP